MATIDDQKLDTLIYLLTKQLEGNEPWKHTGGRRPTGSVANKSIYGLTQAFRTLHGDSDMLSRGFHGVIDKFSELAGLAAMGSAISLAVHSVEKMSVTYSKLTDIGQSFGGSMFSMMQQAGDAGLSVDDFSKALQRNSTVAAILTDNVTGSTQAFTDLQKNVRANLKDQGFYGMTLGELTDNTSDYLETMRETGHLSRTDSQAQSKAVQDLIIETTQLSQITGKSREEIMKQMNAVMRSTTAAFAAYTMNDDQMKSFRTVVTALSAIPGEAGKTFSQGLADIIGLGRSAFTDFGKSLIDVGLGNVAGQFDQLADKVRDGTATEGDSIESIKYFTTTVQAHAVSLQNLAKNGDQSAMKVMELYKQLGGIHWQDKLFHAMDPITKFANTFQSSLHNITGNFQAQFYQGVTNAFLIPLSKSAQTNEDNIRAELKADETDHHLNLDRRKELYKKLNDIEAARSTSLDKTLDGLQGDFAHIAGLLGTIAGSILPPLVHTLEAVLELFVGLKNMLASLVGDKWGALIATAIGVGALWWIKRLLSGWAQSKTIFAKQVNVFGAGGGGGGFGGLPGEVAEELPPGGGLPGAVAGEAGGIKASVTTAIRRGGKMFGGPFGRLFLATFATGLTDYGVNELVKLVPNFPFADELQSYAGPVFGLLAATVGPKLLAGATELLAPVIGGIVSAAIIPATIGATAAAAGYVAYKGAQALQEHTKKGDWYIDQATNAAAPLADNMKLDPNTGMPVQINSADDALSKKLFDYENIKKQDEDAGTAVPATLLQQISDTLSQIREQSAAQLALQRKNNKITEDLKPGQFYTPFAMN